MIRTLTTPTFLYIIITLMSISTYGLQGNPKEYKNSDHNLTQMELPSNSPGISGHNPNHQQSHPARPGLAHDNGVKQPNEQLVPGGKEQLTVKGKQHQSEEEQLSAKLLQANESWFNLSTLTGRTSCTLRAADNHIFLVVNSLLLQQAKLLEYRVTIANHTDNPLLHGNRWTYKLNQWSRVSHSHGVTILSLAFNYGILSLMTLSFGVAVVDVELQEYPSGCLGPLEEHHKVELLLDLLLRDFRPGGKPVITEGSWVCHQVIKNQNGYAKFADQCCFIDSKSGKVHCMTDMPNVWLHTLENLMAVFSVCVILFGPLLTPTFFSGAGLEVIRYVVKLKEPLYKTLCVVTQGQDQDVNFRHDHLLDLNDEKERGFSACKALTQNIPNNVIVPIKITEYNIRVSYEKLLPENSVPVGFWQCLIRAIFMCKMQSLDAFQGCCDSNMYGCIHDSQPVTWISLCKVFGRVLMVLFLPFPFYIRLVVYFMFEEPEIIDLSKAAANAGLPKLFEYRLMQYLTPGHPTFLAAYVMYYVSGMTLAILSTMPGKSKFQHVIIDSFRDLADLSWLNALGMIAKNFVWPFQKLGIFGLFLGIIYWPIAMPISIIAAVFNAIPLVFLTWRLMFHALGLTTSEQGNMEQALPGQLHDDTTGLQMFETDTLLSMISTTRVKAKCCRYFRKCQFFTTISNVILAVITILTFYAVILMVAECASFILHICIFTMMGIIVNASKVLKYGALIFMVILYSYDCYNNVYKQYLKLNKALFSEIKGRIKDIWEVTMLPSYLQENRGFKSQENSDQAEHESADDLFDEAEKHWKINDLILFIDNNDIPRIPKKLFEEVCSIEVPGSPGPVYRSLLIATGKFFLIILFLLFVFIVVLSFGDVYKVSSTNQMLATMAGGFMPFIFRNLLKPAQPDIELGSVSFKSKLEEIVINFWQCWPMYDFRFEVEEEPDEKEGEDEEDEKKDNKDKKDKDKKSDKYKDKKKDKKETFKKKMSMAEMLDEIDFVPSKEEIILKLNETKTYRPADDWHTDIRVVLPPREDTSSWSIGLTQPEEQTVFSLKEKDVKVELSQSTLQEGDNGYPYGVNAIV